MGQVSAVEEHQVIAINGSSDEDSLVPSTLYDPSSAFDDYLEEQLHPNSKPGIFSVKGQVCPTPKVEHKQDPITGEWKTIPSLRYSQYHRDWIPARCGRNTCPACSVMNARRIAGAIWLAQPSHVLTLTQVGMYYADIRLRMTKFFDALRKTYPTLRYTWQVEENPGKTGNHALCYIHLADKALSGNVIRKAVSRVGLGSHFELKQVPSDATVSYFGYQFKDLVDPNRAKRYLAFNGSRKRQQIIHSSQRGFWRDPSTGEVLRRAKAESIALGQSGAWTS